MLRSEEGFGRSVLPFSVVAELAAFAAVRGRVPVTELMGRELAVAAVDLRFEELREEAEEPLNEAPPDLAGLAVEAEARRQSEQEHAAEARIAAARSEGFHAAQRSCEAEWQSRLTEERERLDRLCVAFALDRQRFFAAAEAQVVKLALAVASRVLAREVDSDGLHLRSTVKAALARVQESSATRLRVPAGEEAAWQQMFESDAAGEISVVGDARLLAGQCVLETTVGRVELGVAVQLEEIERSFSELLQVQDAASAVVVEAGVF